MTLADRNAVSDNSLHYKSIFILVHSVLLKSMFETDNQFGLSNRLFEFQTKVPYE